MCIRFRFRFLVFSLGLLTFLAPLSRAQDSSARLKAIQAQLGELRRNFDKAATPSSHRSNSADRSLQIPGPGDLKPCTKS
jgi:hypothetical protein